MFGGSARCLFARAHGFGGEGRPGELMVGDCGEVRRSKRGDGCGWEGGVLRAIVAGCNQSSANTGTHTLTRTHTSYAAAAVAVAVTGPSSQPRLPPGGRDTLTQITRCGGGEGGHRGGVSLSASRRTSSPTHTCGFSAIFFLLFSLSFFDCQAPKSGVRGG